MSDLVNLQSLIDQAAQELKPSTGAIKKYAKRIEPKNTTNRHLLLLDISGSMADWIGANRKLDLLRQALNRPLAPYEIAIAFHSVGYQLPNLQSIPEPAGGTALHLAIAASPTKTWTFALCRLTRLFMMYHETPNTTAPTKMSGFIVTLRSNLAASCVRRQARRRTTGASGCQKADRYNIDFVYR